MIIPVCNGYFITGSDTDVGKTYIGCELVRQLKSLGSRLEIRKPAESGCVSDAGGRLLPADASRLNQANGNAEDLSRVSRYRFRAALAPNRAAEIEGMELPMTNLVEACSRDIEDSLLLVEGAGGFYSPLASDGLNADLADALKLPVIIVVNDRVGAINQALLTVQAVESRHLPVAAIILNRVLPDHETGMDNATGLRQYCSLPVFQCGYRQALPRLFEHDR